LLMANMRSVRSSSAGPPFDVLNLMPVCSMRILCRFQLEYNMMHMENTTNAIYIRK
jgi:hypothetical protein